MNKVRVRVGLKTFYNLKLYGVVINTNSFVAKMLVQNTRDNGSNPSW